MQDAFVLFLPTLEYPLRPYVTGRDMTPQPYQFGTSRCGAEAIE